MKKSLFLLVLAVFLQISSVKAYRNGTIRIHNGTGDNLAIYLKYSKWHQVGNLSGMIIKGALDVISMAGQIALYGMARPTGSIAYGKSPEIFRIFSYSLGNGLVIALPSNETFTSISKNPHEMYIGGEMRGATRGELKKAALYHLKKFKIRGENKLKNRITTKWKHITDVYIEKDEDSGEYIVEATKPHR